MSEAPFVCKFCGLPSWVDPSDQSPPPDYCYPCDHGRKEFDLVLTPEQEAAEERLEAYKELCGGAG